MLVLFWVVWGFFFKLSYLVGFVLTMHFRQIVFSRLPHHPAALPFVFET